MKSDEYITKEQAINALLLKGQKTTRYKLGETWELNFYEIQEAINAMPAAGVQPVSVIKELQEHIKQRILETAFNNGGIYGEVAEDIANRIDIWVDEFRRNKNA